MTHWTDLAIEVAAVRAKKKPKKIGKSPKLGLPKKPKKKTVGGITVNMPQPPQSVFQKNSARTSGYTPAQALEIRRAYAGTREDRVFSGISLRVVKR